MNAETTVKSTSNLLCFPNYDLNLSTCTPEELQVITTHRLLVRTRYPKLVSKIFLNTEFSRWYHSAHSAQTDVDSVMKLQHIINAITNYTSLFNKIEEINTDDILFWKFVTVPSAHHATTAPSDESTTQPGEAHAEEVAPATTEVDTIADHERTVVQRVEHTMKPYRYWCRNSTTEPTTRPNSTRKRNVWIS